jgi:hypothetical protein
MYVKFSTIRGEVKKQSERARKEVFFFFWKEKSC